jgi:hypothetical protein
MGATARGTCGALSATLLAAPAGRWRDRVLAQTGGRCAVPGCRTPDDRVQAHHGRPLADGGEPEGEGVAVCHRHHVQATERERRARRAG